MLIILGLVLLAFAESSEPNFYYYTYDVAASVGDNYWEGSVLGDKFGYEYGPPTIWEKSWNNSKSVDLFNFFDDGVDILITVLEGTLYAENTLLVRHDSVWIPAGTYMSIWTTSRQGIYRSVCTGISDAPLVPIFSTIKDNYIIKDEHAECSGKECAVDIINENKTKYDPYILSVYFLKDSSINLHDHPCGAIYYILEGMMCYSQSGGSGDIKCIGKGESYWTSPENKYSEFAKRNSKILVLGFQCPPVFF